VPDFLASMPFWVAFVALFLGAMARGQMVYWVGRVATEQTLRRTHPQEGWKRRMHEWLEAGGADPGVRALRRWGLVMVPLCYLTVGFQSMVQAAAGILRIEPWKYLLAQIPGALAWATIYATIGFAAWEAVMSAAAGSPLGLAAILVVVVAVVAAAVLVRRRRQAEHSRSTDRAATELAEADPAP
jgi:membrane protein DedA with SNARE-associated domain